MGLYQRRRPEPLRIFARQKMERRDDDKKNGQKSADSPDSPDFPKSSSSSISSASSASPTSTTFTSAATSSTLPPPQASTTIAASVTSTTLPAPATTAPPAASSTAPPAPSTLVRSTSTPAPPPPPPPASTSNSQATRPSSTRVAEAIPPASTSSASRPSASTSSRASPAASSSPQPTTTSVAATSQVPASSQITASITTSPPPTPTSSSVRKGKSTELSSAPAPTNTSLPDSIGGGPSPQRFESQRMSKGIEATLITLSILGFIAVLICLFVLYKRRRRRQQAANMRHAEDAFSPNNNGSLHEPKAAHMTSAPRSTQEVTENSTAPQYSSHMTKSTTNTNSLFGAGHYTRPETVSTNKSDPLPTPNPFADPARNKAFDQIRGRPRSTTLTDRGSWVENPFKDPTSDRFDPFGELQAKARAERVRYLENIRREHEEQLREKEAMGLGAPRKGSGGSGVTVEGVGVLDRQGAGYR